jgi:hypothetical protein
MTSKLDAVNVMLSSIGIAPVTELDTNNPELDIAVRTLDQIVYEICSEGWNFNTENGFTLSPNSEGFIEVPPDVIAMSAYRLDALPDTYNFVERQGKLYDKRGHSFIFNGPVSLSIVWSVPYEELPGPFRSYATQRAARVFAGRSQGSGEMVQMAGADELLLRNSCLEYECNTSRTTMSQTRDNRDPFLTYMPFQTIAR